jgi:hypothetical protein
MHAKPEPAPPNGRVRTLRVLLGRHGQVVRDGVTLRLIAGDGFGDGPLPRHRTVGNAYRKCGVDYRMYSSHPARRGRPSLARQRLAPPVNACRRAAARVVLEHGARDPTPAVRLAVLRQLAWKVGDGDAAGMAKRRQWAASLLRDHEPAVREAATARMQRCGCREGGSETACAGRAPDTVLTDQTGRIYPSS